MPEGEENLVYKAAKLILGTAGTDGGYQIDTDEEYAGGVWTGVGKQRRGGDIDGNQ